MIVPTEDKVSSDDRRDLDEGAKMKCEFCGLGKSVRRGRNFAHRLPNVL